MSKKLVVGKTKKNCQTLEGRKKLSKKLVVEKTKKIVKHLKEEKIVKKACCWENVFLKVF